MAQVVFTAQAIVDIDDIWLWIAMERGGPTADRIVDDIRNRCMALASHPLLGPERTDILPGLRMIVIRRWLALYRVTVDHVEVLRILDGARDVRKLDM